MNAKQNIGVTAGTSFASPPQGFLHSNEPLPTESFEKNLLIPPSFKPLSQISQTNAPEAQTINPANTISPSEIKPILRKKTRTSLISIITAPFKKLWNGHSSTFAIDFISGDIKSFLDRCYKKDKFKNSVSTDIEPVETVGGALQLPVSELGDVWLVDSSGNGISFGDAEKKLMCKNLFFQEGTGRKIQIESYEELRLFYLIYAAKDTRDIISPSMAEIAATFLFQDIKQTGANFADSSGESLSFYEVFKGLGNKPAQIKSPKYRTEKFEDIADLTALAYINGKKGVNISFLPENTRYLLKSVVILNTKGIKFYSKEKEPVSPYGIYRHFKEFNKEDEFKGDVYCGYKDGEYSRIDSIEDLGVLAQNILSPSKEEILKKLEGKFFKDKTVINRLTDIIVKKVGDKNSEFNENDLVGYWDRLIKMYKLSPNPGDIKEYENTIERLFGILFGGEGLSKKEELEWVLKGIEKEMKTGNFLPMSAGSMDELLKEIKFRDNWVSILETIRQTEKKYKRFNDYSIVINEVKKAFKYVLEQSGSGKIHEFCYSSIREIDDKDYSEERKSSSVLNKLRELIEMIEKM